MKALTYDRYGGPEVVKLSQVAQPELDAGEVMVRVHASAVNTADWRLRAAAFPGILAIPGRLMFGVTGPRNPMMGSEFAGTVETVAKGVERFRSGDRVYGIKVSGGASAEYVTMPSNGAIAKMPSNTNFEEAAVLPFGALCSLSFLQDLADVQANQRLMVVGASGGVGCYAVQIGKALGAHVTAIAGPDSLDFVAGLGADEVVDYRTVASDQWPAEQDVIFDAFGALTPSHARRLAAKDGLFLPLNFGLREIGASLLNPLRSKKIKIAVNDDTAQGLDRLTKMVEAGDVRPQIGAQFSLEEAQQAHEQVESRHRRGATSLVIIPS